MKSDFRSESFKRKLITILFEYILLILCTIHDWILLKEWGRLTAESCLNKGIKKPRLKSYLGSTPVTLPINWALTISDIRKKHGKTVKTIKWLYHKLHVCTSHSISFYCCNYHPSLS